MPTSLLHTQTPHNPAGLLVHLHRHYNPSTPNQTNLSPCAFAGMHPQPRLALCAFTDPLAPLWSPCAFTRTHLQTHGAPCAFTWMHHHSNTNTSASRTLFITQNGYHHSPYTCIRLQKTWSPTPASFITEAARKCGGVLARSSPLAVLKVSPRASDACCMRRRVQLHLASCSALRSDRRPRAAVTIFVAGTSTNSLTGAKARRLWMPSSTARVWALLNNVDHKGGGLLLCTTRTRWCAL